MAAVLSFGNSANRTATIIIGAAEGVTGSVVAKKIIKKAGDSEPAKKLLWERMKEAGW